MASHQRRNQLESEPPPGPFALKFLSCIHLPLANQMYLLLLQKQPVFALSFKMATPAPKSAMSLDVHALPSVKLATNTKERRTTMLASKGEVAHAKWMMQMSNLLCEKSVVMTAGQRLTFNGNILTIFRSALCSAGLRMRVWRVTRGGGYHCLRRLMLATGMGRGACRMGSRKMGYRALLRWVQIQLLWVRWSAVVS